MTTEERLKRIEAHLFGQQPTEDLKDWVVPLEHPTLTREEVAERCIAAAVKKGYKVNNSPNYGKLHDDKTHFWCYSHGEFLFHSYSLGTAVPAASLEDFEAYCGVEQPKPQEYNAGFRVMGKGYLALRLPDGSELWYSYKDGAWRKDLFYPPIKPHTLTPVERYTVGKFYAMQGVTGEHLNDWRSYALCVKNDDVPYFVRPTSEYGIISIDRIRQTQVSNLEVTTL